MQKITKKLSVVLALFAVGATSSAAFSEENPAKTIENISQEVSILAKKQELLDARIKYSESMKKMSKTGDGDSFEDAPKVKSIEGFDGKFIAKCVSQNGGVVTRGVGDDVPGGWKIVDIDSKAVVFARGKITARVQVSSGGDTSLNTQALLQGPGLPTGVPR